MALSKTNIYLLFKFMGPFGIECRRMSSLDSAIVCCRDSLGNPLRPLDYASTETGAREVAIVFLARNARAHRRVGAIKE